MNTTARFVHALVTGQRMPETNELTAVEQAVLEELRPLLLAAPQDISAITPEARGWTLGVVSNDDQPAL
ncbi:MAG TPA: hypothetical protein VFZ66_11285 [Herpetosiphonaceae bacterium]